MPHLDENITISYVFPDGTTAPDTVSAQDLYNLISEGIPVELSRYAIYEVRTDGSLRLVTYVATLEAAQQRILGLNFPTETRYEPRQVTLQQAEGTLDQLLSLHAPEPTPEPVPPTTEEPPSTQDPNPGTQDPAPHIELVSISPGVFQIINGRIRGEALYIASSELFNISDPVRARAFMQVKDMSGKVIVLKANGLFFSELERDERIQFDENAFGNSELEVELFVWKENSSEVLAPSKRFVINSGPLPPGGLPPSTPPTPSAPTSLGFLGPLITGALLLGGALSFKKSVSDK